MEWMGRTDDATRGRIAHREAREFVSKLGWEAGFAQVFMVLVLGAMTYFNLPVGWILIAGFFLATGTIVGLILECALRMASFAA